MALKLNKIKPILTGKLKVLVEHLLTNKDEINIVNHSLAVVSKHTEIGLKKIQAKMKQLESIEFVIPYKNGKYLINPYFVFEGDKFDENTSKELFKELTQKKHVKRIFVEEIGIENIPILKNLFAHFIENGLIACSKLYNKVDFSSQTVALLIKAKRDITSQMLDNINSALMLSANTEIVPISYSINGNILPLIITDRISISSVSKILTDSGIKEFEIEFIIFALPFAVEDGKLHLFEMIK